MPEMKLGQGPSSSWSIIGVWCFSMAISVNLPLRSGQSGPAPRAIDTCRVENRAARPGMCLGL
jgi:hypothetical protein